MARTITRAQFDKLNAQAPEGWLFNLRHYFNYDEKSVFRTIELPDGRKLQAVVDYVENIAHHVNEYGVHWKTGAGNYHIELNVSVWRPASVEGVWASSGLGKSVPLDDGKYARRDYKRLCEAAAKLTDDYLMDLQKGA